MKEKNKRARECTPLHKRVKASWRRMKKRRALQKLQSAGRAKRCGDFKFGFGASFHIRREREGAPAPVGFFGRRRGSKEERG